MAQAGEAASGAAQAASKPLAVPVRGKASGSGDARLRGLLEFFGVPWVEADAGQPGSGGTPRDASGHRRFLVLSSASALSELFAAAEDGAVPDCLAGASSIYVYGFQDSAEGAPLLRRITGDRNATVCDLSGPAVTVKISSDFPDLCGPMTGLTVPLEAGGGHGALRVSGTTEAIQPVVSSTEGFLFCKTSFRGVSVFLDGSRSVIDLQEPTSRYFDVKKQFAGAVPLVMYLKREFREDSVPREINACLIIDDPPLQRRYGFLDYTELLEMMREHTFATSIAFIPWNYRRVHPRTVDTFQKNKDKLSICVHGCDHVGDEFSSRSSATLDHLLKTAKQRMHSLQQAAGLPYDEIMVFPQGAFSPEAGAALKSNGFIAAVNTEVAPCGEGCNRTTIGDLWSMAILRYGDFPIFTRRYAFHGLENFAFDGLLGKSCFVVGHHEVFRDHAREWREFLGRLQALHWKLRWSPIGEAVSRSYDAEANSGAPIVNMFAERALLENREAAAQRVTFHKTEANEKAVESVTVNGTPIHYSHAGGRMEFSLAVPAGSAIDVRCNYRQAPAQDGKGEGLSRKVKVAARRYLSEFRDNYLARNDYILKAAHAARGLLK